MTGEVCGVSYPPTENPKIKNDSHPLYPSFLAYKKPTYISRSQEENRKGDKQFGEKKHDFLIVEVKLYLELKKKCFIPPPSYGTRY